MLGLPGYKNGREFKKVCNARRRELYSSISESTAAFVERTSRSSRNVLYSYVEDQKYKCIHKLVQFVTNVDTGRNFSRDLILMIVKNSDFLYVMFSKSLRDYKKLKNEIGHRVVISKYVLPWRNGCRPHVVQKIFDFVAIASRNLPKWTKKDDHAGIIPGKLNQNELFKII